jgi:hypothetical protein
MDETIYISSSEPYTLKGVFQGLMHYFCRRIKLPNEVGGSVSLKPNRQIKLRLPDTYLHVPFHDIIRDCDLVSNSKSSELSYCKKLSLIS